MALGDSASALLFRIKGDASDAIRAFAETKAAETDLTASTAGVSDAFSAVGLSGTAMISIVAAVGVAAVASAGALLSLAKNASEVGEKIYDATQKTGASAETMSALKVAAEQSGSTLEAVSNSVSKFNVLVGLAATGNEKAIGTLHQYGITATDTNGALIQAVATIAKMTDAGQQAAAATALFKDRTGAILPVIKQFDGDLPGLIKNLRDTGLIMSGEDAEAADKFGDEMKLLGNQLSLIKVTLGRELMPVFLDFATQFSDWLSANKGAVKGWGDSVVTALQAVGNSFQILITDFQILDEWSNHLINTDKYYKLLDKLAVLEQKDKNFFAGTSIKLGTTNSNDQFNELPGGQFVAPKPLTAPTIDAETQKKIDEEAKKAAEDRRKEREKEVQEAIASAEKSNRAFLAAAREEYKAEQDALEKAFLDHEKSAGEYRAQSVENIKAYAAKVRNLIENAFVIDAAQAKNQADMDAAEAERTTRLSELKREVDKEAADAIKNIEGLRKKDEADKDKAAKDDQKRLDDQIEIWKKEGKAYSDKIEHQNEIDRERQKTLDELGLLSQGPQPGDKIAGAVDAKAGPFDSWTGSFKEFYDTVKDLGPDLSTTLNGIANTLTDAFNGFANALGNVVEQWVLTGDTGPAVMRKLLAATLASIAAQSAVQAIFELAKGFASLFFNPAEAAAHFTAAALFGSIAVGSALAGRAVAGNSFKQQSGAATGRSGSGSGSSINQNPDPYSRTSGGAFDSGTRPGSVLATAIQQHTEAIRQHTLALDGIHNKIGSMPPGEVLTRGIQQRPGVVADSVHKDIQRDSSKGRKIAGAMGFS